MTGTFLKRLAAGERLVADGATGTNYQHQGLRPGVPPEEWNIDCPEKVLAVHRNFVQAGADIILTNSFGGTRLRMADAKYGHRVVEINKRAADIALQAAHTGSNVLVAGSMGPTGALLQPLGPLKSDQVIEAYAEQAEALTDAGVDFLLLETMFSLDEAVAAITGVRQGSRLPLVCSFSFDRGVFTMMGVTPTQVVETLRPLGLAAIGANCGMTLDYMAQVVSEFLAADPGVPLWVKPNAGLPRGGTILPEYDVGPAEMADYAKQFALAGAQIVGGCCGTTPEHVKSIAQALKFESRASHA
ncbi:MAG: homocysteine S-methyltransferase family protein [Methyloligellaceae bacterium]